MLCIMQFILKILYKYGRLDHNTDIYLEERQPAVISAKELNCFSPNTVVTRLHPSCCSGYNVTRSMVLPEFWFLIWHLYENWDLFRNLSMTVNATSMKTGLLLSKVSLTNSQLEAHILKWFFWVWTAPHWIMLKALEASPCKHLSAQSP